MCINWSTIFLAILLSNSLQLVFEASLLYSLEIMFTLTPLERLQYPDRFQENGGGDNSDDNPDQKKELDCGKVMSKCFGEMAFIGSYMIVILAIVVGLTYSIKFGHPLTIMVEFFVAWAFDQLKSVPIQFAIYWVVIRRFGYYENVNLIQWDDETIAEKGPDMSLLYLMRKKVADFLEQQRVVNFILGMVILLCVVIFSELALSQQIDSISALSDMYDIINYIMLTFFVTEIIVKIFAYGHLFLIEFINVFDSTIVIVSYVMLILRLKAKILGILRVLRLIKVIINLKRVADEKREQKELIKEQKRQGSQMASYVERVIDFFERLTKNPEIEKTLREDVEWAIDIISANKLYQGGFEGFKLQEEKPEIKAWTDLITLKAIPSNIGEMERLKQFEEKPGEKREQKGIIVKPGYVERHPQGNGVGGAEAHHHHHNNNAPKKKKDDVDESKVNLLKETSVNLGATGKVHPSPD